MSTTKLGSAAVSYGIGVQNRYSAFLEDEDGLLVSPVAVSMKRPNDAQVVASSKQRGPALGSQQKSGAAGKSSGRSESAALHHSINQKKHDAQQQSKHVTNGQQQRPSAGAVEMKRQQQQQQLQNNHHQQQQQQRNGRQPPQTASSNAKNTQAPRQAHNKPGETNHDNGQAVTANSNNRYSRNQANGNLNHQSNASHQHTNKENNEASRPFRNNNNNNNNNGNQRFSNNNSNNNNRPRLFQHDERKGGQQQEGQMNGNIHQTSDEEKRRRQQKRAIDMKHKDPEKGEARRNQAVNGLNEQSNASDRSEIDESFRQRNPRNRRDSIRGQDESSSDQKGARVKAKRNFEGEPNGERRDGQQGAGRRGDKLQRNRNGFGTGSRNTRNVGKNQEKSRPIPNISDNSDFPSLAS